MIEAEVKLPVAELTEIKEKLLKTGFKETAIIEERDTYFDNKQGDIRTNGEALRVRETIDHQTGKSRAQINFKGKKLDTCTMTRQELETGVEDGNLQKYSTGDRICSGSSGGDQGQNDAAEWLGDSLSGLCAWTWRISGTGGFGEQRRRERCRSHSD